MIRGDQRSSEVLRGPQGSSGVLRYHQRPSEVIRGPQRSSARLVCLEDVTQHDARGELFAHSTDKPRAQLLRQSLQLLERAVLSAAPHAVSLIRRAF